MKRTAIKVVNYSRRYRKTIVNQVIYDGFSVVKVCHLNDIANVWQVRDWVKEYRQEKGLIKMPKMLIKRRKPRTVIIPETLNKEIYRLEEIIIYLESTVEAMFAVADEETKKKLLEKLSPSQRLNLKRKGRL
jgi:transposase-like protein